MHLHNVTFHANNVTSLDGRGGALEIAKYDTAYLNEKLDKLSLIENGNLQRIVVEKSNFVESIAGEVNSGTSKGGAIFISSCSNCNFMCTRIQNSIAAYGGGIYVETS